MSINLIGQGYCPTIGSSVAAELIGLFKDSKYNSFTCVVAFASRDAVSALKPYIMGAKRAGWSIRIIVGIDQGGTSAQALEELLSLDVSAQILHLDNNHNNHHIHLMFCFHISFLYPSFINFINSSFSSSKL